jgi:hypothetical protein
MKTEKWVYPLVFLAVIIGLIAISAEIDWFWNGGLYDTVPVKELAFVFLFGVFTPVVVLFGFYIIKKMPLSADKPSPLQGDRKKFVWSIIIIVILQNTIPVVYLLLDRDLIIIDVTLAILLFGNFVAMAALAAYYPIHPDESKQTKRWFLFFLIGVFSFYVMIGGIIGVSWMIPDLKLIYWILMWGVVMPMTFVFLGLCWKARTGERRQAFNIAFGGILIQYSFLEDVLFYALNGQPQPTGYNALLNLPIDIAHLFGHQGIALTPAELLIWLVIMLSLGVLIIFDVPYQIYHRLRSKA